MFATHALKYGEKYCRFGSYCRVDLVDNPLQASLYSTAKLADKRRGSETYWAAGGTEISGSDLKVELKVEVVSET